MLKDFDAWNQSKQALDQLSETENERFYEREIWYVSIGINIGFEILGKGLPGQFSRPVLILKKHNRFTFFGLPLGSTVKEGHPHYFPIETKGRKGSILLTQGRTFSSKRLLNRMVKIPDPLFNEVKQAYKAQY